jgi:nucleotide-binding universal stress UspA family protein
MAPSRVTYGRGSRRRLVGSSTRQVVADLRRRRDGAERSNEMKRILVAYDGGDAARRALATAIELAEQFKAPISVVSVIPVHPGRAPIDPWDDQVVHAQELQEAKRVLAEHGIIAELLEPAGDPAATIERIAEEGGFDTVVVGSRGLGTVSRFLRGSVSEHVATHADATVVIAR